MSSLPSPELLPILKRLNAAVGYLNLGMPQDAFSRHGSPFVPAGQPVALPPSPRHPHRTGGGHEEQRVG